MERKDEAEIVAFWDEAGLIKFLEAKMELKGGSKDDRFAAEEWISQFRREAAVGNAAVPEKGRQAREVKSRFSMESQTRIELAFLGPKAQMKAWLQHQKTQKEHRRRHS